MSSTEATNDSTQPDVAEILTQQHEELKTLMAKVPDAPASGRQTLFAQVCALVAAHEAAEAAFVHSAGLADLGPDDDVVRARLHEEDAAGAAIATLEALDIGSDEFLSEFAQFQKSVIDHAEAEEHDELPAVADQLTADQVADIVAALREVPQLAQSHALQVGTFAAMLEAARAHFGALSEPR